MCFLEEKVFNLPLHVNSISNSRDTEKNSNYFLLKPVATNLFSCILLCRIFAQQNNIFYFSHPQHTSQLYILKNIPIELSYKSYFFFSMLDFLFEKRTIFENQNFFVEKKMKDRLFFCRCCLLIIYLNSDCQLRLIFIEFKCETKKSYGGN